MIGLIEAEGTIEVSWADESPLVMLARADE